MSDDISDDFDVDSDVNIVNVLGVAGYDAGLIGEADIDLSVADVTDYGDGEVDIVDALQMVGFDGDLIGDFGCGSN